MTASSLPGRLGALAAALLLAGCSLAPVYHRPEAPVAAHWPAADAQRGPSSADSVSWQDFIIDAPTRQVVELALNNNRDLRKALQNIEVARAQYGVQRADRLPRINALGNGTRQRLPADLSTRGGGVQGSYEAGIGISAFELDLFGRVRSLSDAALQDFLATEEAARATRITLIAELLQAVLDRESAQLRLDFTRQTLQAREASLNLIEQRRRVGAASALDRQEAVGLTEQARADLESIERALRQADNALVLLAGTPDVLNLLPARTADAQHVLQEIAPGLPSALIERRPDIRAAERTLQARNASIGAARAAFFPRISLTGQFGSSSAELSGLFGGGSSAWSFMPQITLPLFSAGANQANLDLATARRDIAVTDYEKTIQTAFREVADALAATDTLRREESARAALAESGLTAMRLSEARYRQGVDGHLRYLDAQRTYFAQQINLIEIRAQRQGALVTLFRSLGGDWTAGEGAAYAPPPEVSPRPLAVAAAGAR